MSTKLLDELKQYLEIDKQALDDELVKQASLFYKVSDAYVGAVSERDSLKEYLAETDAILDGTLRTQMANATETKIKNAIIVHPDHAKVMDQYLAAKEAAARLEALKDSFAQRGYMLRDLTQLYISNYYGTEAVRGTPTTGDAVYGMRRQRMAAGRKDI